MLRSRIVLLLGVVASSSALFAGIAGAGGPLTTARARSYLAKQLRAEWKRNTISMNKCWRVSGSQVNCNARINGSKANAYCLTTVAAILRPSGALTHRTLALHCHTPPLRVGPPPSPSPLPPPPPPPPASPPPPTAPYAGLGGGHYIVIVSFGSVTLEDGSRWSIAPSDTSVASTWSTGDDITVELIGTAPDPYLLEDTTQGDEAAAKYIGS
jgi:hypothetical protein